MKLAWGNAVPKEFSDKVLAIAKGFGWPEDGPSWLMACIAFESAATFSPSIRNAAGSGATGLIQFMPKTAEGLGTTTDALAAMTAVEQLDFVKAYFKPYAARIKSLSDMYMAILLPKAVGMPDEYKLFSEGAGYRQNAGLDANNDGIITKIEAAGRVQATLWKGMQDPNVLEVNPGETNMDPLATSILSTAIPAIWNQLPEIAAIFKKPDVAARNVEAVQKVGQIMIDSAQAANIQEAVTKVQTDKATAQTVNDALRMSRADILDMLDRVNDQDQKNIAAARAYNTTEPSFLKFGWIEMRFVHFLSLVFVSFAGVFVTVYWKDLTPELRGAVVTLMMLPAWGGVRDYWMGSSDNSARKTELLTGKK